MPINPGGEIGIRCNRRHPVPLSPLTRSYRQERARGGLSVVEAELDHIP